MDNKLTMGEGKPEIRVQDATITITVKEYQRLKERDAILGALEGAGVDNWDGYDYAMETLKEDF